MNRENEKRTTFFFLSFFSTSDHICFYSLAKAKSKRTKSKSQGVKKVISSRFHSYSIPFLDDSNPHRFSCAEHFYRQSVSINGSVGDKPFSSWTKNHGNMEFYLLYVVSSSDELYDVSWKPL